MTTTTTLKEACEAYIGHMKSIGQKPSTLGTIQRTLGLLMAEMGEEKEVGKILTMHVDKFLKSETATMQTGKDGLKPRAPASALQIRRIVLMALVWWHEQGLIAKVPVPAIEKAFLEKAEKRTEEKAQAEAKPKRGRKANAEAEAETEPEQADPEHAVPAESQAAFAGQEA